MEEKIILEDGKVKDKKYYIKVIKKLLSVLLVFIGLIVAFKFAVFFLPFVIALIINQITKPLIKLLNNKLKFNNTVSVIISVILVIGVIGCLLFFGITKLYNEIYNFTTNIQQYTNQIYNTTAWIYNEAEKLFTNDMPDVITKQFYTLVDTLVNFLVNKVSYLGNILVHGVISLPTILIYTIIAILATLFIGFDKIYIMDSFAHQLPDKWTQKIMQVSTDAFSGISAYVKSQTTIIGITLIELLLGFNIFNILGLKVDYVITLALTISIIDAFPILGCGTVLIPWAVYNAFVGNIKMAIALFILYLIITIIRQLIEPKIISKNIGVHPIFTLIAMYTGFKLFGFLGFILGPILMFMLKNIFSKELEKGFFRDIFQK